jgi:hypothetical protein
LTGLLDAFREKKPVDRFLLPLFHLSIRVARFFLAQHTKTGKIYQMTTKYGRKIDHHLPPEDLPKITQIGIFGLKIYHLATLLSIPCKATRHFSA